jgi:hypothetical protein
MYRCKDLNFITENQMLEFQKLADETGKLSNGLKKYLISSSMYGSKFKSKNNQPGTKNQELKKSKFSDLP